MNKNSQDIPSLDKLKNAKNNFHDPNKFSVQNDDAFYIGLYATILNIKDELSMFRNAESQEQDLTLDEKLQLILEKSYDSIVSTNYNAYGFFDKYVNNDVSNVCLFFGLCSFIQETNKIPSSSLTQYIYANPSETLNFSEKRIIQNGQSVRNSNYIDLETDKDQVYKTGLFYSTAAYMRQYKSRLFANRVAPISSLDGQFMPKASEHEWHQFFDYVISNKKDDFADTFKRIGNLYKDVYKVLFPKNKNGNLEYDNTYSKQLERAYKRFNNKLKKLDVWNYFLLCEKIGEHIKKDTTYYGINLYRLEKELKPYIIVQEMNKLISCRDEKEFHFLLDISVCLKDIPYPKIYDMLANIGDYDRMSYYAKNFLTFLGEVSRTFMLILDQFVEENLFGKDFAQFFYKTINNLAPDVLYEPIEYSHRLKNATNEMYQMAFSRLLAAPVNLLIWLSMEEYVRQKKAKESNSHE